MWGTYLHGSKVTIRVRRWHAHGRVHWRWRCGTIRCACRARVVLAATPTQADTGVADRIALHLVDSHLGGVTLHELNKSAAFSGRDLNVGNFSKALKEGTKLVFGDISRKATHENGGVVRVRELVHRLWGTIVTDRRSSHGVHAHWALSASRHAATHCARSSTSRLVLRSSRRDPHGAVSAIDTLHLGQGALLVTFIREANKAIPTRHSTDWIGHDLRGLA